MADYGGTGLRFVLRVCKSDTQSIMSSSTETTALDVDRDSFGKPENNPESFDINFSTTDLTSGIGFDPLDHPLDSDETLEQYVAGIEHGEGRDGDAIPAAHNRDSISTDKLNRLSLQASGNQATNKRPHTDDGSTSTSRKRRTQKDTCPTCKRQKKGAEDCGWTKGSFYEVCSRAANAKTPTDNSLRARLQSVTLYKHGNTDDHELPKHPMAVELQSVPNEPTAMDIRITGSPGLPETEEMLHGFENRLLYVYSGSSLARDLFSKSIAYTKENKDSATAAVLRLWAVYIVRENLSRNQLQSDMSKALLQRIITAQLLTPLRADIVTKLEEMLFSGNPDKWVDFFQASFLLLYHIGSILVAGRHLAATLSHDTSHTAKAFCKALYHTGQTILAHYHSYVKAYAPRSHVKACAPRPLDWFDGNMNTTGYTEQEMCLVEGLKKHINFKDGDYCLDRVREPVWYDDLFFWRQLFFTEWAPPFPNIEAVDRWLSVHI